DLPQLERYRILLVSFAVITEYALIWGLPAQLLMNEVEDTANAIYCEVSWYLKNTVPLRKYLLMTLMRSQKGVSIRAGNYHVINNETVVLMLKTAYSFYTFLQTLN
ncbi:hypothetical protein NQ315_005853, partial [Exocentrus adspersus]